MYYKAAKNPLTENAGKVTPHTGDPKFMSSAVPRVQDDTLLAPYNNKIFRPFTKKSMSSSNCLQILPDGK